MAERFRTSWSDVRAYMDWTTVLVTLVLFVCGLAAIYSASASFSGGGVVSGYVVRQCIWGALGACAFFAVIKFDYRNIIEISGMLYVGMVLLLFVLLIAGHTAKGAQSWFNLGFFHFQPSELGKVVFAVTLAKLCTANPPYRPKGLFAALGASGLIMALVLVQPDLGSTLVFIAMLGAVLVVAGTQLSVLVSMLFSAISLLPLGWMMLKPYQRMRLLIFIDPTIDPQGAGYNVIQSRIAVGSGGLFGKGFTQGTQGKLHFLPEPHTDFIFSVFSEEFGFVGCVFVLFLFGVLLIRILAVSLRTKDVRAKLMCIAVAAWFWFQIAESIAMSMGLAPVTGLPLPLFSYGGSSLLVICIALGLVQSAHIVEMRERF